MSHEVTFQNAELAGLEIKTAKNSNQYAKGVLICRSLHSPQWSHWQNCLNQLLELLVQTQSVQWLLFQAGSELPKHLRRCG